MKFYEKTLEKFNVKHSGHSWTIRLVGRPEYKAAAQLIKFLESNGFVYRITNSSITAPRQARRWYIDSSKDSIDAMSKKDWANSIYCKGVTVDKSVIMHQETGEVYAKGYGEVIHIMVYTRSTSLTYTGC